MLGYTSYKFPRSVVIRCCIAFKRVRCLTNFEISSGANRFSFASEYTSTRSAAITVWYPATNFAGRSRGLHAPKQNRKHGREPCLHTVLIRRRGPQKEIGKCVNATDAPTRPPGVDRTAEDSEHLQGLQSRQMRCLDRSNNLNLSRRQFVSFVFSPIRNDVLF